VSLVKRNVAANFAGKGWSALMSLAFIPVYTRLMGMEAYGLVGFSAVLNATFSLLDMGLTPATNREMARLSAHPEQAQEARDTMRTLELIYWPIGLVIAGVVLVAVPLFARYWLHAERLPPATVQQAVVMMGLSIALQWPYSLYEGGLLGLQRQVLLNGISITANTARGVGSVLALLWIRPTIQVFFAWQILVSAGMTFAVSFFLWRSLPPTGKRAVFDPAALRKIWRFAAGMTGIALVSVALMQMDKLVLSRLVSLRMLGYYTMAANLAAGLIYGVTPFYAALFPRFVQLLTLREEEALARLYHRGCQIVSVVILPVAVVMILFSRELMQVWTHNPDTVAHTYQIVSLLVAGYACNAMVTLPYALQLASGWTRLTFTQNLISLIVMLPLLVWMTRNYGPVGAAVVWVLLNSAYVLINVPIMHRRLLPGEQWRWYGSDLSLPLLAALGVAVLARWWMSVTPSTPRFLMLLHLILIWAAAAIASALAAPQVRALLERAGLSPVRPGRSLMPLEAAAPPGIPAVSIGLPVYNGEKYLCGALDALLNQTFSDFEIILSDNASTDATEAICRKAAAQDPRIRYIRQPENRGGLWNFDFVLHEARGAYFMWAAVDDLWSLNFLEVLRECLEADPQAVGAQGEYDRIDAEGKPFSDVTASYEMENPSRFGRVLTLARQRATNIYIYGLFRTSVLQQIHLRPLPFTKKYAQSAEFPVLYYLGAAGTLRTDRRARFSYRHHPSQESNRKQSVWVACLLRLGLMVVLPGSVWKGSRSLATTVPTSFAIYFYQLRAMLWFLIRRALRIRLADKTP